MPRPMKPRRVCCLPDGKVFAPRPWSGNNDEYITITVDEYETFRLMDYMGMSQEECAKNMDVARTTVQKIYSDARKKLAMALVDNRAIRIEGGDFRLYSDDEQKKMSGSCRRHRGGGCAGKNG